jgi:hypothetical protein
VKFSWADSAIRESSHTTVVALLCCRGVHSVHIVLTRLRTHTLGTCRLNATAPSFLSSGQPNHLPEAVDLQMQEPARSTSQEPSAFYGTVVRSLCSQVPSTGTYPQPHKCNPKPPIYFPEVHFTTILPPTYGSSEWSIPFRLSNQNFVHISYLPMRGTCPVHVIPLRLSCQ